MASLVSGNRAVSLPKDASERTASFGRRRVDRFLGDNGVDLRFLRDVIPQRGLAELALAAFVDVVEGGGFVEVLGLHGIGALREAVVVRVALVDVTRVGLNGLGVVPDLRLVLLGDVMRAELGRVLDVMNVGWIGILDVVRDVGVGQFEDLCTLISIRSTSIVLP